MPSFGPRVRRGILPACGAAALLVLLGAAPAARAACGDYVTVIRPGEHPPHDQAQPPGPMAPGCHGPGCSAPPTEAAPVAPPRLVERPSLDLAAEPAAPHPDAPARAARGPGSARTPAPLTTDIFHPPRAS